MGQAVGNVLPLAVAVALFPVPIVAVVLVLGSDHGRAKGLALVGAWCAGLSLVGAVGLVLAGALDARGDGEPATWVSLVLLGLGLLLIALAAKSWRGRPRAGDEASMPPWMQSIDRLTTVRATGVGFVLSALNPKNVLLVVAAAAEIAEVGLPAGEQAAALAVFVVLASFGVLTPLVLSLALGARAEPLLERVRAWLSLHNAAIMTVLLLVIGAKLIGDAIAALVG